MFSLIRNLSLYFILGFACIFPFCPGYSYYRAVSFAPGAPLYRDLPAFFRDHPFSLYPVKIGREEPPELSAEGVFVVDVASAVPLFEKNVDKPLYPASTTKMMTALVARDVYSLDEVLEVPEATFSGSLMKLVPGERITVRNLLYGLLISSGNDAAEVLAYHHPLGRSGFISQMNEYSLKYGLRATYFENPSGLPSSRHISTAWDLGHLAIRVLQDDFLKSVVSVRERVVYGTRGERHVLKATNKLLGVIPYVDGVKTGYTDEAGEVLVTSVTQDTHQVVIVLLKSRDRFVETELLISWIYRNFEWRDISWKPS